MSESQSKNWIFALAGIALGVIVMKVLTKEKPVEVEKPVEKEEVKEEHIEHQDSMITKKAYQQNYKKKMQLLRRASKIFTDDLAAQCKIAISRVPHLAETHDVKVYDSPLLGDISQRDISGIGKRGYLPDEAFSSGKKFVISGQSYQWLEDISTTLKFLRAGPRRQICFDPKEVRAAIVTCGGLCPGINVVIREIVMSLWYNNGVRDIYGVKWGFQGFHDDDNIIKITPLDVANIHHMGGSWLGSSRGGFDNKVIVDACKERGINQLYIIGGDGTHKGIYALYEYTVENKDKIVICGVPKTIDNDIPIIDKSFGFDTAVEEAVKMIKAAVVEAESAENGVGLVKLMGRDCGYIAAYATLASRDVNICLIPESPFEIEGENGVCENVCKRLKKKGHCVIVIAEGADDAVLDAEMKKGDKADGGGHFKHADIGTYLRSRIVEYGKEKHDMNITLKYIDPTYAIRSVPANASDTVLWARLAMGTVNAAMAGYTGFSVGAVKGPNAIIPIKCINQSAKQRINLLDRDWQRVLANTGQPQFVSPEKMQMVNERVRSELKERKEKYEILVADQIEMSLMLSEDMTMKGGIIKEEDEYEKSDGD